ncbi:hypothetical protein V2J09_011650 [Rumex salicifolius]
MDSYAPLLERTKLPQPSLQRFAVSQIFDKLQSAQSHLGPDSDPGRECITRCLHSSSPAVVDQSIRELCKFVECSTLDISRGLLELQSALESSDPSFVDMFVMGLGFLVRIGFKKRRSSGIGWEFEATERHPFVKEFTDFCSFMQYLVDSHVIVMRNLVKMGSEVKETQLSSIKLLKALLSPCSNIDKPFAIKPIIEFSRCLLGVQKELGLPYPQDLLSPVLSLFVILNKLEVEHEQLSMLNLLAIVFSWRIEDGDALACDMPEMHLFNFPLVSLMSSTSKSVKGAAVDLLLVLEKLPVEVLVTQREKLITNEGSQFVTGPEMIIFRLLQRLWLKESSSTSFFLNFSFTNSNDVKIKLTETGTKSWISQLGELALCTPERQKLHLQSSLHYKSILTEAPLLMSALVGSLLLHQSISSFAVDTLAALGTMEPKLGFTLLLCILYYNNFLRHKSLGFPVMLLKLMTVLPTLASHNAMVPFVVQTIMPMLQKNVELVLYATAIRLMCKTWEINDKVFGSLQGVLLPGKFSEFASEREICISMAASLRDICRKNPDRGVDLILSVSACIESHDPVVQVLGFHSLGHLCEADVVAWVVISKYILDYTADPLVARGLCSLLRWGSMDAGAYPEASKNILKILWEVANFSRTSVDTMWANSRKSAFEALYHFELVHIEDAIEDYKRKFFDLLVSESCVDVLSTMEQIEDKIIAHEHKTRRRLIKEKRVPANKIEKLLHVLPQALYSSVKTSIAREMPGAALLCLSFVPKEVAQRGQSRSEDVVVAQYGDAMKEIVESLHLSRNIVLATLSLESWKPFMQRWLKAYVTFLDTKASSAVFDKTSKAANNILKKMIRMAEDSIPRSAESVALALGAFCMVLPPSVHAVKIAALKFLLTWLYQSEHEYRQWSAAISIGLVSSSLHITDHKQKLKNINALIEVAGDSKSSLVKGACGVGLGFASQDLLLRVADVGSLPDEVPSSVEEMNLLGKIVRTLSSMIFQLTQISSDLLQRLSRYIPPGLVDINRDMPAKLMQGNYDKIDADVWGVAGLILGLGSVVSVLYRAGSYDTVHHIKALFTSWVSCANSLTQTSQDSDVLLSVGACLALPAVVSFCWKVELMHDDELDSLMVSYKQLISVLLSRKVFTSLHQSLLIASCVGSGNLLACILSEGVHALEAECVKELLCLFKKAYSSTCPHIIHFGGMLGVVNAMGAGTGTLISLHCCKTAFLKEYERKEQESAYITGSLLSSLSFEPLLTSMMQDIFLVAQSSEDNQLQQYASWAASLFRHYLHSRELENYDANHKNDIASHKATSHSFPEDSAVMKLSLWLINLDHSMSASSSHVNAVSSVLRCLSRAPRLPVVDWLAVVRGCMRYRAPVAEVQSTASSSDKGVIREDCLCFSMVHADKFDPLLSFLDELSDLSRFRTLDPISQSYILSHLLDLMRLFSSQRLWKLFNDIAEYFSSPVSLYQGYGTDQKSLLRIACWKGLSSCLDETLLDKSEYISSFEKCMEVLFLALPGLPKALGQENASFPEEWVQSFKCLGKSRLPWLLDLLKILKADLAEQNECFLIAEKKIRIRAQLVRHGFLPVTELGKLKVCILNAEPRGLWDAFVDVVSALQRAEGSVKRQWLLDVLEISCITNHPTTALQFIALLSGSCCKYMPLLVLDPSTVLHDLPVTLSSLLHNGSWAGIAESAASYVWATTTRVVQWAKSSPAGDHSIAESENEAADLLALVLLETCFSLKEFLPFEKQLRLATMRPL